MIDGKGHIVLFKMPTLDGLESKVLKEIEQLRKKLSYLIGGDQPKRWTGILRRNAFARNVRGSNAIEGFHVTMDDAVAAIAGEPPLDASEEAWLANVGYRDAMTFVLQKPHDQYFTFSAELLKSLHFMMLRHDLAKNPGRWRPGIIFVRDESTGEQVYEGPPADRIAALIQELIDELNAGDPGADSVVRGAMAHLNLVMIHPFSDGNGRMSRCLQTLVLCRSGILDPNFSSIEEYLGRPANTRRYYDVLAAVGQGAWHPERDARPWMRFSLLAHYHQATTVLRRAREMQRMCDELEAELKRLGLPERSVLALADAAVGNKVRNGTYRDVADVSDIVAGRDLKALVRAGFLEPEGENRGRVYVASPIVKEIRRRAAESKALPDPFETPEILETNLTLPGMEIAPTLTSSTWPPRRP
jgi:Fic family protein